MRLALILISGLFFLTTSAQRSENSSVKIMFYNVENLLDPLDDPATADDEFLPEGMRNWTEKRFIQKIDNIAKVIVAAGAWEPVDLIGLCEVENLYVLERLVTHPLLKSSGYGIIHKESPDHRGMDVALLYRRSVFFPQYYSALPIREKTGEILPTREILHVEGKFAGGQVYHLFINHWPSRYGGLMETRENRILAASCLKQLTDSLQKMDDKSNIICMGDFNDQPQDESLSETLGASLIREGSSTLVNLSADWAKEKIGTIKHEHEWAIFDQFIVTENLRARCDAFIYSEKFLLEEDRRFSGFKPFRTYVGFKYNGGFSDHLPVLLKLNLE